MFSVGRLFFYRPKVTKKRNFPPAIVPIIISDHVQNPGNGYS